MNRVVPSVNVDVFVTRNGVTRLHDRGHNLVVQSGLNYIRDLLIGAASVPITHVAVGTGNTAVVTSDIALQTEVFRGVFTQVVSTPAALLIKFYLGPLDANGNTLKETGIFTASNVMYARRIIAPVVKVPETAITVNWTLSWEAGS